MANDLEEEFFSVEGRPRPEPVDYETVIFAIERKIGRLQDVVNVLRELQSKRSVVTATEDKGAAC